MMGGVQILMCIPPFPLPPSIRCCTHSGHVFHRHCVLAKVAARWPGAKVTFHFLECPICRALIEHANGASGVSRAVAPLLALRARLRRKAVERAAVEGLQKEPKMRAKLRDAKGPYFGRPVLLAEHSYAFYSCYKCKEPYFGGRRDCEQNRAADNSPAEEMHVEQLRLSCAIIVVYRRRRPRFSFALAAFIVFQDLLRVQRGRRRGHVRDREPPRLRGVEVPLLLQPRGVVLLRDDALLRAVPPEVEPRRAPAEQRAGEAQAVREPRGVPARRGPPAERQLGGEVPRVREVQRGAGGAVAGVKLAGLAAAAVHMRVEVNQAI